MTPPHTKHPAKFSDPIVDQLRRIVDKEQKRLGRAITVLDPFAGVGRIHLLASSNIATTGVEIEPEWASCQGHTIPADCRRFLSEHPYRAWVDGVITPGHPPPSGVHNGWDVVATSPCYGNRFADSHDARDGSTRRSYTHDLGRKPSEGSSATLHWGTAYKEFHADVYALIWKVLRPGGLFVLNVSDIVRQRTLLPTSWWHEGAAMGAGFELVPRGTVRVPTKRMRYGENHGHDEVETGQATRAGFEVIFQFRRPTDG
jgi:hypothetical protein